jgi:iron complex transport system substrate-binding protein
VASPSTSDPRPAQGRRGWREIAGRLAPCLFLYFVLAALCAGGGGCRRETRPEAGTIPRRIVALTPSLTETLFALGLGDRVVGVGDYTSWPPEARSKPRLGGLFNPNVERIAALHPDLAILMPSERDLVAKLGPLGVEALIVPIESLADIERSFATIAERCGVPEAGARLRAEWKAGLESAPMTGPRPRVVLSVGRDPGRLGEVTVAASRTFLDEILARAGGVNAFADAPALYPQAGLEELVARAPDLIVELRSEPLSPAATRALAEEWKQLPQIAAVRQGRVVVIATDYALVPGPRLPLLARDLRQALSALRGDRP